MPTEDYRSFVSRPGFRFAVLPRKLPPLFGLHVNELYRPRNYVQSRRHLQYCNHMLLFALLVTVWLLHYSTMTYQHNVSDPIKERGCQSLEDEDQISIRR